jgi:hypothetical protein
VLLLQVSDIPGVVHMVEYHDMGDSIWIVLERGDHTKVTNIFKKSKKLIKKYLMTSCSSVKREKYFLQANKEATCR